MSVLLATRSHTSIYIPVECFYQNAHYQESSPLPDAYDIVTRKKIEDMLQDLIQASPYGDRSSRHNPERIVKIVRFQKRFPYIEVKDCHKWTVVQCIFEACVDGWRYAGMHTLIYVYSGTKDFRCACRSKIESTSLLTWFFSVPPIQKASAT